MAVGSFKHQKVTLWQYLLVILSFSLILTVSLTQGAPVTEDELQSSGDVEPVTIEPLGSSEDQEDVSIEDPDYIKVDKSTPAVYKTMTPEETVKGGFTTQSTSLPPIPPTTANPTIPPRTSMLPAVQKPTSTVDLTKSPTESTKEKANALDITTVSSTKQSSSSDEGLAVGGLDLDSKTTTPETTTQSTVAEGGLVVEPQKETTEKVGVTSTTKAVTEQEAIIVDKETTKVIVTSETPPTTTSDEAGGLIVDGDKDDKAKSTTQKTEPEIESTKKTTTSPLPPIVLPGEDGKSTSSPETTQTTEPPSTTKEGGIVIVPEIHTNLESEDPSKKNDSEEAIYETKTGDNKETSAPDKGVKNLMPLDGSTTPETITDDVVYINASKIGESTDGGLSNGARTGIAMGCIVGFWIILGPIVCCICKLRDKKRDKKEQEERNAREKVNSTLVEEMVKAELQKTPNGDKKHLYINDKFDDKEVEPITIGDTDSMPYIDADANSRDTAL